MARSHLLVSPLDKNTLQQCSAELLEVLARVFKDQINIRLKVILAHSQTPELPLSHTPPLP